MGVKLDQAGLGFALTRTIDSHSDLLRYGSVDSSLLKELQGVAEVIAMQPFEVDLQRTQNAYYEMLQTMLPEFRQRAADGEADVGQWVRQFVLLGIQLGVRVD